MTPEPGMKRPSSQEFVKAVGSGATTEEVAATLKIPFETAQHNLNQLKRLMIINEVKPDQWRRS